MRIATEAAVVVALALTASVPAIAARTRSTQVVRGRMSFQDSDATGRFEMRAITRGEHAREEVRVRFEGLDATADGEGNLPEYHLWLVTGDGGTEADFGAARLRRNGHGGFRYRFPRMDHPDGVDDLRDFGGGAIELRDADDALVLEGTIPDFRGIDADNGRGSHSVARAVGTRVLDAVAEDSRGRGRLTTRYLNRPSGTDEQIHLVVKRLDRGAYTLVAIDDSDNETEIGRFRAISRAGVGVLHLDTRQGTNLAAGVLDLGGQRAEVRDADGSAVLRGRFPDLL